MKKAGSKQGVIDARKARAPNAQNKQAVARDHKPAPARRLGYCYAPTRLRAGLLLWLLAAGFTITFGFTTPSISAWLLKDGYVATRATIVTAPFWAERIGPKNTYDDAVAGWHMEIKITGHDFALPVALADFDPDGNYFEETRKPDPARFAVGKTIPVWFFAAPVYKTAQTVSLLDSAPPMVLNRAVFTQAPSLNDALHDSIGLLVVPMVLGTIGVGFFIAVPLGRSADAADSPFARRAMWAFGLGCVAYFVYLISNDHPLADRANDFEAAEVEVLDTPRGTDSLTNVYGYRLLWRTWRVPVKILPDGPIVLSDVDGLDPRRSAWANRFLPDGAVFAPGTRLPVWRATSQAWLYENTSGDNIVPWHALLSRERWPEKYTWRHFVADNPSATAGIATLLAAALLVLIPLGRATK
jgi:hypothetical protein